MRRDLKPGDWVRMRSGAPAHKVARIDPSTLRMACGFRNQKHLYERVDGRCQNKCLDCVGQMELLK